jgi:hypothetical protein
MGEKFMDLTIAVQEYEEEEETRDLKDASKTTKPIASGVQHSQVGCIGSDTTLKQKNIKKLFVNVLKECEQLLDC